MHSCSSWLLFLNRLLHPRFFIRPIKFSLETCFYYASRSHSIWKSPDTSWSNYSSKQLFSKLFWSGWVQGKVVSLERINIAITPFLLSLEWQAYITSLNCGNKWMLSLIRIRSIYSGHEFFRYSSEVALITLLSIGKGSTTTKLPLLPWWHALSIISSA